MAYKTDFTCIEIRNHNGRTTALLVKDNRRAPERYIVARDYNALAGEWYGGGLYYDSILEAAQAFERITRPKK